MKNMVKKHENQEERVAIFVDGSNFYYKLRSLSIKNITYFNYAQLSQWLARERIIVSKTYFIGVVRAKDDDVRGQLLRKTQLRLFNHLSSKKQGFCVERGYLMKNDGVFHEKGVDVKMAVDLLVGAYENMYDTAIVLSSDTDLIPAIQKVISLGKKVEYIGFAHQPSYGLQKHVTLSRLLIREEVMLFQSTLSF
jgi:uncharacterized LabA/DUF88 family protein